MNLLLVGAGGHARVVTELVESCGHVVCAYVDRVVADWLGQAEHFADDDSALRKHNQRKIADGFALGIGGVRPDELARRFQTFERYAENFGNAPPAFIHSSAFVANRNCIAPGTLVMAGALVNSSASIGRSVIVNTGAVVEHNAIVGDGAHLAPRSVVLGGVQIGMCSMIGAGAVVLPDAAIPDNALVPALTRYPAKSGA